MDIVEPIRGAEKTQNGSICPKKKMSFKKSYRELNRKPYIE